MRQSYFTVGAVFEARSKYSAFNWRLYSVPKKKKKKVGIEVGK